LLQQYYRIIQLLLAAGADPNAIDDHDHSFAAFYSQREKRLKELYDTYLVKHAAKVQEAVDEYIPISRSF